MNNSPVFLAQNHSLLVSEMTEKKCVMQRLRLGLPSIEAIVSTALKAIITQENQCFQTFGSIHSQKLVHFCLYTITELSTLWAGRTSEMCPVVSKEWRATAHRSSKIKVKMSEINVVKCSFKSHQDTYSPNKQYFKKLNWFNSMGYTYKGKLFGVL